MENLEGEISILKAISHRHIVELEDCIVSKVSLEEERCSMMNQERR